MYKKISDDYNKNYGLSYDSSSNVIILLMDLHDDSL